jgi:hypothetical protein
MSNRDPELVLAFQSVDLKGPTDFSTYPVTVDRISYLPFYIWDHQTTLTLLLFPEVPVSNLCLRGRVLVLGVTNLPLSTILRLHFGTDSTVWYFLFFILWQGMFYPLLYFVFTLITNNTFTERLTLSGHLSSPIVFPVGPCCSSYP